MFSRSISVASTKNQQSARNILFKFFVATGALSLPLSTDYDSKVQVVNGYPTQLIRD